MPWILIGLWTGLAVSLVIAVAATPDDFGLNGIVIGFIVICWAVGLVAGAGISAVIRRLRKPPVTTAPESKASEKRSWARRALLRLAQLAVGLIAAGIFAGLVYATSGASRPAPLSGLRWTDETPAWSPNGREVVFASNRAAPNRGIDQLYLMQPNGADVRQLTAGRHDAREPSFSPDGKEVVFAANVLDRANDYTEKGAIDLISVDGNQRRSLTSGFHGDAGNPAWSPNGRWIAFVETVSTDSASRSDLYVVRPDGSDLHRLAIDIDDWSQPFSWAPDSRQVALVGADERIYRIGVDAKRPVRVTHDNWDAVTTDVAWSPDGREVAYVRGHIDTSTCFCGADGSDVVDRNLWILDLANHRRTRVRWMLDSGSLGDFGVSVTWLPARKPLLAVFSGSRTAVITAGGRKIRSIKTPNGGMLTAGSASTTGRQLLFVDGPDNSYRSAIFAADTHGGRIRPLTQRGRAAG